jgi:hypothetical protein
MTYEDRKKLPYGMFTAKDGRQVIFGREYRLLFERAGPNRKTGEEWQAVSEQLWLDLQNDRTIWFYDDATPARLKEEIAADWMRRIKEAMKRAAASPEAKARRYENAIE